MRQKNERRGRREGERAGERDRDRDRETETENTNDVTDTVKVILFSDHCLYLKDKLFFDTKMQLQYLLGSR